MSTPTVSLSGVAVLVAVAALPVSWALVALVRRFALANGVMDQVSARSSHRVPTPRGGGLGLVGAVLVCGGAALILAGARVPAVAGGAAAVLGVALIGWLDDRRSLGVGVRLAVHAGAGLLVALLADVMLAPASAQDGAVRLALAAAWAIGTVASINLVNFMDGIDGIIGLQLAAYAAFVAAAAPTLGPARLLALAAAAAAIGFLRWNWAPAAIFLGDVGSGAVGVLVVLLGLALRHARPEPPFLLAYLPLVPLFLDATVTLSRRVRRGERLTTPHRSHLYQRLANGPWSHARTSAAFGGAALVGGGVALLASSGWRTWLVAGYVLGVLLVGWRLDALAPWAPARTGASPGAGGRDETGGTPPVGGEAVTHASAAE